MLIGCWQASLSPCKCLYENGTKVTLTERAHNVNSESRFFRWIDSVSLLNWLLIWLVAVFVCAISFWLLTWTTEDVHGLRCTVSGSPVSFFDAVYFSIVTITTLGYGDLIPYGLSRWLAMVEAVVGVFVVGALVSKALSQKQERLLLETNELAFRERLGRILTNIQYLLVEFQGICPDENVEEHDLMKAQRRMANAVWTLAHVLQSVSETIQHQRQVDALTMKTILATTQNTLNEFQESRERFLRHGQFELERTELPETIRQICGTCLPAHYPDDVRETALSVSRLADQIFNHQS